MKPADPRAGASSVTLIVCGTGLCNDGKPHDDLKMVIFRDENGRATGGSVACSRCGSSAMDRDMLRLP